MPKESSPNHISVSLDGHIVPIEPNIFSRLEQALKKHRLEATFIGGVVAFGVAAAVASETLQRRHQKSPEEALPQLSPDQEQSFTSLYTAHHEKIRGYLTFVRDLSPQDAEDVTQKIFLQARKHFAEFVPKPGLEDPYKSWLYTIATNLAKNAHRDQIRHPAVSLDNTQSSDDDDYPIINLEQLLVADSAGVEDQIIHREHAQKIKTALHKLIPEYQLVIWLKTLDFSNAEIQQVLGLRTENAAKSKYHRAINSLKNRLDKLQ